MNIVTPSYYARVENDRLKEVSFRMRWGDRSEGHEGLSEIRFTSSPHSQTINLRRPNLPYDRKRVLGSLTFDATEYGPNFRSHVDCVEFTTASDTREFYRGTRRGIGQLLDTAPPEEVGVISVGMGHRSNYGKFTEPEKAAELRGIFTGLDGLMASLNKVLCVALPDLSSLTPEMIEQASNPLFKSALRNVLVKAELVG